MANLAAYTAFARAFELGSFSATGRELGLTQSTVSKHIAALEVELGVQLFARTTRKLNPTLEAERLYEGVQHLLDAADAIHSSVGGARAEPTGLLRMTLPDIAAWAQECGAAMVVALTTEQIDLVASVTLGGTSALLVDPDITDCAAALTIAAERARLPAGVADIGRESDTARFHRLSTEVARIADTLARLTRAEERDEQPPIVGDRTTRYGAPPAAVTATASEIRRAIRARRMRDQFFGGGYFEDPGWDMLLDLYAAELEGTQVSVSSLCIAAAVAPTTALRWIGRMSDAGLFERRPDPLDRRRAYMALSTRASEGMQGYMAAVRRLEMA
ncbi:MAG: LysR family transcriptional regulator, partial [Sphingomonas sp.]